jgi:hypothetical protein
MRGQPRRLSRWKNLANEDHEECSFVSARGADKTPAFTTILKRRLNMKAAIAAVLASPAMAQQGRPQNAPPPNIPRDARASVAPYGTNEGGPYTPSAPTLPHGTNRDFQNGSKD